MNKLKKLLIAVCCVLLFTATALFAVACDDDTPDGETPEPKQYTVTLDFIAEQGNVTLAPTADNNKYDEGTEVTVTVTAKENYAVDKVTVGGSEVSLVSSAYTFKVTADTTVKATFKDESVTPAEEYTVTLDYNKDQGDVKLTPAANSNGKYAKGTTVTVEVTAKENYAVEKVTVGGNEVNLAENKHSFEVTGDVTVQVTFKETTVTPAAEYTVSLEYNHEQGEVTLSPKANDNGKYAENTVVTVNIVPNEHYLVKSVTVGGAPLEKQDEAYTFTVTSDVTVAVEFQKESAKFSEQLQGELYWLTPGEPFDDEVKVQNINYGDNYSYTRQHTAETYQVNYSAEVDGATYSLKANGEDVTAVAPKTEVTLSFTLKTGYLLEKLTVGGYDVTADLAADGKTYTYTFPVLTDLAVVAEYKQAETYTVTVNVTGSENGTVTLNSTDIESNVYSYTERDTVVVTVKPNTGKAITSFMVDGKEVSKNIKNDAYTFEITANTEISVTFADKTATSCNPRIWGAFTISTSSSQTGCIYLVIDATGIKVYKNPNLGFGRDTMGNLWNFSLWGESCRVETETESVNEDGSYTFKLTGSTITYRVCYSETTGITYLESNPTTGVQKYYPMVRYIGESAHEFTAPENFIGEWKGISSTSYRIVIEANAFKSFTTLSSVLGEYEVLDENHILVNGCSSRDYYCRHSVYLLTLYKNGDYYEVKTESVGTAKMDDLTLDKVYARNGEYTKFHVTVDMPEGQGAYSFSTEGDTFRGTVTLTIKPYGGYVIDTVTVDGEPVTPSSTNTVKLDVQKETEVKVTFKEVTAYSITVENDDEKGTVTFAPECLNGKLNENVQVKVTATAVDGWFVSKITVTGIGDTPQVTTSKAAKNMSLTVSKLTANITVTVEYTKAYTIEVDSSTVTKSQGTVTSSASAVVAGGSYTLTVTVKAGYVIDTFTVNGDNKASELVYDGAKLTYTVEEVSENLEIVISMKEAPSAAKDAQVTIQNGGSVVYDTTDENVTGKTQAYVVKFTLAAGTTVKGGLYADVVDGSTTAQKTFEMFDPTNTGVYCAVVVFDKSGQKLAFTNKSGAPITGSITSFEKYTPVEITEVGKEYVVPVLYYNQNNATGNYAQYATVKVASELLKNYYMTIGFTGAMTTSITPCGDRYSAKLSTESTTSFSPSENRKQVKLVSSIFFVGTTGGFVTVKLEEIPTHKVTVEADEEALKSISAYYLGTSMSDVGRKYSVDLNAVLEGTANINYTITPNDGWAIVSIKGVLADGTTAFEKTYTSASSTSTTITMNGALTQDMTITVTFSKTYKITYKFGIGGSCGFNKSMPAFEGTEVTYTVTPKDGYLLDTFTINGVDSMDKLQQGDDGKYTYTFELTEELNGATFEVTFKVDEEKLLKGDTGEISLKSSEQVMLDVRGKEKGLYLLTVTRTDGNTTKSSELRVTFSYSLHSTGFTGTMNNELDTEKYEYVVYLDGTYGFLTLSALTAAIQGTYSLTPYAPTSIDDGEEHNVSVLYMSNSTEAVLNDEEKKGMLPYYTISDPATYTVRITFPSSATRYTTYYLAGYKDGKVQTSTITSFKESSPTQTIDLSDCDEVRIFSTTGPYTNATIKFTKTVTTTAATSPVALPADLKSLFQED